MNQNSADIKTRITESMKQAMREQAKERLGVLRLILAEFKQKEVDERIIIIDEIALKILDKMVRQRRDAINQFIAAQRNDLVTKEEFEINVIQEFLPEALPKATLLSLIDAALMQSSAKTIKDMGKVMAILKPQIQGRADIMEVSNIIKSKLGYDQANT